MLIRAKGDDTALAWLAEQKLSVGRLASNGVLALCQAHLRREDVATVEAILDQATAEQIDECPQLLMLRGIVRFASVLSKPDQKLLLMGLQLDVRRVRPILLDAEVAQKLDLAAADFERLIPFAKELELANQVHIAEEYLVWLDLVHPARRDAALARLRVDMQDPGRALGRIQYAFAYDPTFDPTQISQYLERREQLGGLNDDEVRAGFLIALHCENPGSVAAFIAKYRPQLDVGFGVQGIRLVEVQALARSGDAAGARVVFDANKGQHEAADIARLNAEIATAEGADPVTEYKRAYESAKTAASLRALVATLAQRDDYRTIAPYAEELFALTDDPRDVAYDNERPMLALALAAARLHRCPLVVAKVDRLTRSTLILQCSEDIIASEEVGKFVRSRIPGSEIVFLKAAGHCPNLSAPAEVVSAIRAYV